MTAPLGLGFWLWQMANAERGDYGAILDKCQKCGISWLAIKAGEGSARPYAQWSNFVLNGWLHKFLGAGISIFPWWYSRPGTWTQEVQLAQRLIGDGSSGLIVDAEAEWQGNQTEAGGFATALRNTLGPSVYIAHAPFDYPKFHQNFPYAQFDGAFNAVHPQMYWTEHGVDVGTVMTQVDAEWKALLAAENLTINFCPIGVTYGKSPAQPRVPGTFRADDLAKFLDHYQSINSPTLMPAVSLYSWDAADPSAWDLLEERAGGGQ